MKSFLKAKNSEGIGKTGIRDGCAVLFFACLCFPSYAHGGLTLMERGQVFLLGAETASQEVSKLEKHYKKLRTQVRFLEKQVDARVEGWRRAAMDVSRLEDEMKDLREEIREKKRQEKELLKRGIGILDSAFHHKKKPVDIKGQPQAYLILGKAMAKAGRHLDAAHVFRRLETASVAGEIKQKALNARIAVLDAAVSGLKLPDPPDPAKVKTRPEQKQLPKTIRLFHEALDKYVKIHPDDPKSALYAYWMGSHQYLYARYSEARRWFAWIIEKHCRTETALEAGRIILQSVVLEKDSGYLERLLKTVKYLRKTKCWRNRRCKRGDKQCEAWSRKASLWMLELAELEEKVEKRLR